jgi:hypothetical protein
LNTHSNISFAGKEFAPGLHAAFIAEHKTTSVCQYYCGACAEVVAFRFVNVHGQCHGIAHMPDSRSVVDGRFFDRRKHIVLVTGTIAAGILGGKNTGLEKQQ